MKLPQTLRRWRSFSAPAVPHGVELNHRIGISAAESSRCAAALNPSMATRGLSFAQARFWGERGGYATALTVVTSGQLWWGSYGRRDQTQALRWPSATRPRAPYSHAVVIVTTFTVAPAGDLIARDWATYAGDRRHSNMGRRHGLRVQLRHHGEVLWSAWP